MFNTRKWIYKLYKLFIYIVNIIHDIYLNKYIYIFPQYIILEYKLI
jgi:hypothetical protein